MIKLKTFEIKSPFKNLDSLKLDFEKCNGITVLIGNNGSGKSNLIEALSSVFAGLYDHSFDPIFSYELTYEKDEAPITIKYDHSRSRSKYQYSLSDPDGYLPNQIISVYSGEESRLWNRYYFKFYNDYMKDVISSRKSFNENQKMVFINKYYWNTALLTMLVSDLDIEDILGDKKIERIEFEFKSNNRDNITNYNDRSPNDVTRFAAEIFDKTSEVADNTERRSISLSDFRTNILFTHTELFKLLSISLLPKEDSWKLINKIELFFEDGFSTEELSEGEKKQILIKFITRIFSDDNSLLLMDEPDSHIHISNKEKIKNLLYDLVDQVHVQSILTTHSPTLTHCFENDNVYMLVNREGKVIVEDKTKQEIVNDLTSDFWNLQEQNIFNSSQKPISLFVEGKHDKIHIQNAFNALREEYSELSFDIYSFGGESKIQPFMNGLYESGEFGEKIYLAIYDNDKAGQDACSKKRFPRVEGKTYGRLYGDHNNFFAFVLPKPEGHTSDCTIENMYDSGLFEAAFDSSVERSKGYFGNKSIDDITKNIKEGAKNILADQSRDFDTEDFKHFRALFDQVKAIKVDFDSSPVLTNQEEENPATTNNEATQENSNTQQNDDNPDRHHEEYTTPPVWEIYQELKNLIQDRIEDVEFNSTKYYISLKKGKNFGFVKFRKRFFSIVVLSPDNIINSHIENNEVRELSESVQGYYNGVCSEVLIRDNQNLTEIVELLEVASNNE